MKALPPWLPHSSLPSHGLTLFTQPPAPHTASPPPGKGLLPAPGAPISVPAPEMGCNVPTCQLLVDASSSPTPPAVPSPLLDFLKTKPAPFIFDHRAQLDAEGAYSPPPCACVGPSVRNSVDIKEPVLWTRLQIR